MWQPNVKKLIPNFGGSEHRSVTDCLLKASSFSLQDVLLLPLREIRAVLLGRQTEITTGSPPTPHVQRWGWGRGCCNPSEAPKVKHLFPSSITCWVLCAFLHKQELSEHLFSTASLFPHRAWHIGCNLNLWVTHVGHLQSLGLAASTNKFPPHGQLSSSVKRWHPVVHTVAHGSLEHKGSLFYLFL